jgi:hypothetical protein
MTNPVSCRRLFLLALAIYRRRTIVLYLDFYDSELPLLFCIGWLADYYWLLVLASIVVIVSSQQYCSKYSNNMKCKLMPNVHSFKS